MNLFIPFKLHWNRFRIVIWMKPKCFMKYNYTYECMCDIWILKIGYPLFLNLKKNLFMLKKIWFWNIYNFDSIKVNFSTFFFLNLKIIFLKNWEIYSNVILNRLANFIDFVFHTFFSKINKILFWKFRKW